jgi:hypothetical protein
MKRWKIIRIYLIEAQTKQRALDVWAQAVANGTTEELLQTIVVKEDEERGLLQTVKKQVLG